jgi:hypothetical protein
MEKFLHKQGMDDLPGALTPANIPTDNTPVDPVMYQSTQGGLNFYGPIRTDIKLFVNILSKRNHHPVQSDRDKQIQIMRYLKIQRKKNRKGVLLTQSTKTPFFQLFRKKEFRRIPLCSYVFVRVRTCSAEMSLVDDVGIPWVRNVSVSKKRFIILAITTQ